MMLKRALIGVLVLVAAVFLYIGYSSYDAGRGSASAATTHVAVAAKSRSADGPISTTPATVEGAEEVGSDRAASTPAATGGGTVPAATDTIQPNPPNGMTFGGSGHYQLYRQGDLTWRLNTDTGESCIVFATQEEWRKPQVYRAGCKNKS